MLSSSSVRAAGGGRERRGGSRRHWRKELHDVLLSAWCFLLQKGKEEERDARFSNPNTTLTRFLKKSLKKKIREKRFKKTRNTNNPFQSMSSSSVDDEDDDAMDKEEEEEKGEEERRGEERMKGKEEEEEEEEEEGLKTRTKDENLLVLETTTAEKEEKRDDDEEGELRNAAASDRVVVVMTSPIKRRFTQESVDDDQNIAMTDDSSNSSRSGLVAEESVQEEGGEAGEQMIFYRVFARLQKKDLRKERSATNDLKFISRVGLGEDDDGGRMRLVEARSRSEKLDAVLLLDVDDENVASEAAAETGEGEFAEKTSTKTLRDVVKKMVEKAKTHFDDNSSDESAALISSIFLDDAMNSSVATASVQSNGALIIPVSAKTCVLKSARLVIIARAKEWLKVSFSPLPFNNNNNNNRNGYKFVVLVITDAYAMHKQTKNALATSGTIATLFSDEEFYFEALAAGSVSEFREAMCRFLYRHGGDDDGNGQPQERTFSLLETTLIEEEADREQRKAIQQRCCSNISFFARISDDFHRVVKKRYWSDFADAFKDAPTFFRALNTIVWLFFNTTVPCLAVGLVFTIDSDERIGLESFLTSEALANVAFSLFGGQSALVFRITGPTLAFLQVVRITASRLNAHMVTFYSIVALVSGLSSMLFASFSGASLIKYVGRFFAECLRMFVAVIFMYSSINAMRNKGMQSAETVSEFLKYFILHIGTFTLSRKIQSIKTSPFLKTTIRKVLSDLAPAIGLLVFTGVSYIAPDVPVDRVHDERYKLSGTMWPTYTPARYSEMKDNPKSVLVACFCGVSLAVQVFFESQISAVLSNRPENKLKKGKSYHYDYFIVGVINALQGLFGLPIAIPSLPHSPIHARISSLSVEYQEDYVAKTHIISATENGRFTNLCASLLRLLSLWVFRHALYGEIPVAAISGFLLYMGYTSLEDNDIWKRFLLMFTQREQVNHRAEESFRFVRLGVINAYTILQILSFAVVFTVSRSTDFDKNTVLPVATFYPLLFILIIVFATYVLPIFFAEKDLRVLTKVTRRLVSPLFC